MSALPTTVKITSQGKTDSLTKQQNLNILTFLTTCLQHSSHTAKHI